MWALNAGFVRRWCHQNPIENLTLKVVTAPRASNPYLHAQAGLFTVVEGEGACTVDEFLGEFYRRAPRREAWTELDQLPWAHRFSLPNSEAGKLLRLLSYEGISAASVFPDVSSAVEFLRERGLWDVPLNAEY